MAESISLPNGNSLMTLTHPKPTLWIIEIHSGPDSRLTHDLVNKGLKPALDMVEREWRAQRREALKRQDKDGAGGALIIVGKRDQDKFFSNGLDFDNAIKDPHFFQLTFDPLLRRLLVFPLPTIAAINGHCYAGALMLALVCDYRVMTDGSSRHAWLCMNEIHFGSALPHSFTAVLRAKIGDHRLIRKIVLEGHKFTPQEALQDGILDHIVKGKTAEVLSRAEEVAARVSVNAALGAWGVIKLSLYSDALKTFQRDLRLITPQLDEVAARFKL